MSTEENPKMSFILTPEIKDYLVARADREDRSLSSVVRILIEERMRLDELGVSMERMYHVQRPA